MARSCIADVRPNHAEPGGRYNALVKKSDFVRSEALIDRFQASHVSSRTTKLSRDRTVSFQRRDIHRQA